MDQLEVDWDIARDIIAEYLAITASQLAHARNSELVDTTRINELETRLGKLHQEKLQISSGDSELIRRAFTEYAQELKKIKDLMGATACLSPSESSTFETRRLLRKTTHLI
jgi:hypothetical protein